MKKTRFAFWQSVIALVLCISMLLGSTYAWFTDTVSSTKNVITAGNLDLEMYWTDDLEGGQWHNVEEDGHNTIFSYDNWEPGYTEVKYIKLVNAGKLALNYELLITPQGGVGKLAEVINVFVGEDTGAVDSREDLTATDGLGAIGLLDNVLKNGITAKGTLLAAGEQSPFHKSGETVITVAMNMITTAGNEYQNQDAGKFTITALATQAPYEKDSFGADYDAGAEMPEVIVPTAGITVPVTPVNGAVGAGGVTMAGEGVSAIVPEGTLLAEGAAELTLTITPLENTTSDITVVNNEILIPVDVHIEGVAENNTTPIIVNLGAILPKYLNMGNYKLAHVEDGVTNYMEYLEAAEEFSAHNQFKYDPLTGETTVAMASFSEVAVVAEPAEWEGNYATAFSAGSGTEEDPYIIANGDQLAYFGAVVGGMKGHTKKNFEGEHIKLVSDIDLGDIEGGSATHIFYPIGYYYTSDNNTTVDYEYVDRTNATGVTGVTSNVSSFSGTFDGNGHTVKNFYQNTWEMFGDYNDGYSGTPNYYKDAMGLFGYVNGGTVKNLTVDHFSSDGEFTPTGVIAAYADGNAIFENIAITNCNPRVYNTGNGGIIGIAGDTSTVDDDHITLKNITVDNSNKISALWGSWDVACGGLVGMYRGNVNASGNATDDTISFENCHVSAQIDVYNDVCANYQYYAYRYAGMIIGSVRHNTTNDDGKTIPNMTGISASGCTVNYGDWNDYYYCEFEENTMASYSEDYQFSRVPNSEIDTTNGKENATCIGHDHTEAEDKQAVYLPFHQLFTGYSWGVSSIGLEQYGGIVITDLDITESDKNKSVVKFEKAESAKDSYKTETTVTIGELFKAADITENDPAIDVDNVQVTVSPSYGTDSTASATYTPNTTDWTQGTLTFSGIGPATVIITDYYYCTPTKIALTVAEPDSVDKFDLVFENANDYLYRVGNANTVSLGSLFKAKDGVEIGNVTVTVKALLGGATVSGAYTADSTWTAGTLKFSGTGPVLVTIDDDAYANEKILYLEVVDATNVTAYSGLGNRNSVLLNDITMSSGGSYYLSGATLYGNGFTFNCEDGATTGSGQVSSNYVVGLSNATIDNVQIIGAVYTKYGATASSDYNRPLVLSIGNSTITNSYLSNCSAPVRIRDGNLEMINTTVKGGNFANIDIRGGHVVLDNVTTINQVNGNDTATDGTVVVGLGVVVYYENVLNTTTIEIKNCITQYNYLSKSQADEYIKDATAKSLTATMFNTDYNNVQYSDGSDTWVNAGILSMTADVGNNNITDVAGYVDATPSMSGVTGYLHTKKPDATSIAASAPDYATAGQGPIAPSYSFDYTTKNYIVKGDTNDYCYEENGTVYLSMDEGDTFNWDTSILTATKNGQTLSYTVAMNGADYTGKSIAFNATGNYEVSYSYTDANNYAVDENGNIVTYSKTYTKIVHINVSAVKASAKHAGFTFGSDDTASTTVTVGNNTYVMPDVSATSSTIGSTTVDGNTIYYPIVEIVMSDGKTSHTSGWYAYFPVFSGAVTITDYADEGIGDAVIYGSSTTTLPDGLSVVGDPSTLFKYQSSSSAGTSPVVKNNILVYSSPSISAKRSEYNTVIQYSYQDNAGATYYYYIGYHAPAQSYSSICVTPDTLVTLADGTKAEIQNVRVGDEVVAWNFYTGKYEVVPVTLLQTHGTGVQDVLRLKFEDGTELKVLGEHGIFDADLNTFIFIDKDDVENYVGHSFAKQDGDAFTTVKLVDYEVYSEYTTAYTILSMDNYNVMLEDMFTVTPAHIGDNFFNPFDIGEDMKYDDASVQADIEKYGLYTYEDFDHVLTLEQFEALNLAHFKVSVGKGYVTYEGIIYLIEAFINNEDYNIQ